MRACLESEVSPHDLDREQLARIMPRLVGAARSAIGQARQDPLARALEALVVEVRAGHPSEIRIDSEHDARRARLLARQLCDQAGAPRLVGLKVATGLSELTRNLLNYAG